MFIYQSFYKKARRKFIVFAYFANLAIPAPWGKENTLYRRREYVVE